MSTPFPDSTSVVQRVTDLVGGPVHLHELIQSEFGEMTKRWEQDVQAIGRILRAHLYVEHYLTEYIQNANPNLGSMDGLRLSFHQKVGLLDPSDANLRNARAGIKRLNEVRNRLAHQLSAEVTLEDVASFMSDRVFASTRGLALAPGSVGGPTPLDILEQFAQHAAHMLRNRHSVLVKAFGRVMEECGAGAEQSV